MHRVLIRLLMALIGGIVNRIRGGGLTDLAWNRNWVREGEEKGIKSFSKILYDTLFAVYFSVLLSQT